MCLSVDAVVDCDEWVVVGDGSAALVSDDLLGERSALDEEDSSAFVVRCMEVS